MNPFTEINQSKIIRKVNFDHPYFDVKTLYYQKELKTLQNLNNTLFCGSYFGYGFHEDGIKSSLEMMEKIK